MLRSEVAVTFLVVIINPLLSAQIKSAMMSDLISLRVLLMLEICLLDKTINLSKLAKLIGTITYFLNDSFVVMLSLGFSFFGLLRTLYTSSIFFAERFRKFSLIFMIFLMLLLGTWAYNWLVWGVAEEEFMFFF